MTVIAARLWPKSRAGRYWNGAPGLCRGPISLTGDGALEAVIANQIVRSWHGQRGIPIQARDKARSSEETGPCPLPANMLGGLLRGGDLGGAGQGGINSARLADGFLESCQLRALQDTPRGEAHLLRVYLCAVLKDFIMQVRSGGSAGAADIADDIALLHSGAGSHALGDALHVCVGCGIFAVVADADIVSVTGKRSGLGDNAIAGGVDGGAVGAAKSTPLCILL